MALRDPDGFALRTLKAAARVTFDGPLRLRRIWARRRGAEAWKLGGDCQHCAACCERPSIQVDYLTWSLRMLRAPFLWWQRAVNGFELVEKERGRVFAFRCLYFEPVTRRCRSYQSRPGICRDYPRFMLEQPWPEFLPGCGYRAVSKNADRLLVTLGRASISEEKRAELKRRLKLE